MGVILESGYSVPSPDPSLDHARIAHAGNWRSGGTVAGSATATGFFDAGPQNTLDYLRWKPYDAIDFGALTAWTANAVTAAAVSYETPSHIPGNPITKILETATTAVHGITKSTPANWTANPHTLRARVKSLDGRNVMLKATSGTTSSAIFNLNTGAVTNAVAATGQTVDLGNGWFDCILTFTPTAASGDVRVQAISGTTETYLGDITKGVYIERVEVARSTATWTHDFEVSGLTRPTLDYAVIAGHTLGSQNALLTLDYWDGSVYQNILTDQRITDNSPIFIIFAQHAAGRMRVTITEGNPEIGLIKFGRSLIMERPIYGAHNPLQLARKTETYGNTSEGGRFLGRSVRYSAFVTKFAWSLITAAWARTNLDPFIKAAESEPFMIAWRPSGFSEVGYCQTTQIDPVANIGTRDLTSWGVSVKAAPYSDEGVAP